MSGFAITANEGVSHTVTATVTAAAVLGERALEVYRNRRDYMRDYMRRYRRDKAKRQ